MRIVLHMSTLRRERERVPLRSRISMTKFSNPRRRINVNKIPDGVAQQRVSTGVFLRKIVFFVTPEKNSNNNRSGKCCDFFSMANKNYTLSWKNHPSEVSSMLNKLRDDKCYTDATIVCDGSYFPVHRVILSTASQYFKELFHQTNKLHLLMHPVIVLHDMKKDIVQAVLDYIYLGEVSVPEYDLPKFLNAARVLNIKVLGCGVLTGFLNGQDTQSTPVSGSNVGYVDSSEKVQLCQNVKKRKLQENVILGSNASSEIVATKHRKSFPHNISLNSKTVRNAEVDNDGEAEKQGTQCNIGKETCSFQPCAFSETDNPLDTEEGISHSIDDHSTTLHHHMSSSDCYSNQTKGVDEASSYGTSEEVFTSVGISETSEPVPGPSGYSILRRAADKNKTESGVSDLDVSKETASFGIKEEVIKVELDDSLSDALCTETEIVKSVDGLSFIHADVLSQMYRNQESSTACDDPDSLGSDEIGTSRTISCKVPEDLYIQEKDLHRGRPRGPRGSGGVKRKVQPRKRTVIDPPGRLAAGASHSFDRVAGCKQKRCRVCFLSGRRKDTTWQCRQCQVPLCGRGDCSQRYHTLEKYWTTPPSSPKLERQQRRQ